jgi:hypothetical protein
MKLSLKFSIGFQLPLALASGLFMRLIYDLVTWNFISEAKAIF